MPNDNPTPTTDRAGHVCSTAELGPAVPDTVLVYLHAYGDSRADEDGFSGLRIGEAILALRRWAAELQTAERERWESALGAEMPDDFKCWHQKASRERP